MVYNHSWPGLWLLEGPYTRTQTTKGSPALALKAGRLDAGILHQKHGLSPSWLELACR